MKCNVTIQIMLIFIFLLLFCLSPVFAGDINLSGRGWKAWLDNKAQWENDTLYLPSEIIGILTKLPINEPAGGWETLGEKGKDVLVPMTMDEYFIEGVITNTYEGASLLCQRKNYPQSLLPYR